MRRPVKRWLQAPRVLWVLLVLWQPAWGQDVFSWEELARLIRRVRDLEQERDALAAALAQSEQTNEVQLVEARIAATLAGRVGMREVLPPSLPPEMAWSLNDAGLVMQGEGRLEDAALLFTRARDLLRSRFPEAHPALGTVLQNLAEVLWLQRKDEAWPQFEAAAEIFVRGGAATRARHAALLNSWATALAGAGRYEQATAKYLESVARYRTSDIPLDMVAPLHNLALLQLSRQQVRAARELLQEAHAALKAAGEDSSSRMVAILLAQARVAYLQGESEQAMRLERAAQGISRKQQE